jgi:hypothetical protein
VPVPFREPRAFDEPPCGDFEEPSVGCESGERLSRAKKASAGSTPHERLELGESEGRVHEERSRADRVRILRIEEHPLASAKSEDGAPYGSTRRRLPLAHAERSRQLGVADGGALASHVELERGADDDVATVPSKQARPVAERAVFGFEVDEGGRRAVERAHAHERLAHFLPICTDVLDGGRSDESWDAREALDSAPSLVDRTCHEGVPALTRGDLERHASVVPNALDPTRGDAQDETRKPVVRNDDVAAPSEDEHLLPGVLGFV